MCNSMIGGNFAKAPPESCGVSHFISPTSPKSHKAIKIVRIRGKHQSCNIDAQKNPKVPKGA